MAPDAAAAATAAQQEAARTLREEGNRLYGAGNYLRAHDLYSRSIVACPTDNAAAYCNRALLLIQQQRPAEALADCEAALAQQPGYPKACLRRGMALRDLGRHGEALECLQALLAQCPGDSHVVELVGQMQRLVAGGRAAPASATAAAAAAKAPQPAAAKPAAAAAPAAAAPAAPVQRTKIQIEEDSDDEDGGDSSQASTAGAASAAPSAAEPAERKPAAAAAPASAAPPAATSTSAAAAAPAASRLHQSASALAAAALASHTPKQPAPPRSAHDFEQASKALAGHPDVLRAYVSAINPAAYASIFKSNLSDKSIKVIVDALNSTVAAASASPASEQEAALGLAARALAGLTKVQRFDTMYGLSVRLVREDVRALVGALEAAGQDVSALKGPYKL